jgi:hypothetical protein
LNVGASEFVPSLVGFTEDGSGTGTMEGDDDLEVDERETWRTVHRRMVYLETCPKRKGCARTRITTPAI